MTDARYIKQVKERFDFLLFSSETSQKEAAAILGISPSNLANKLSKGTLRAVDWFKLVDACDHEETLGRKTLRTLTDEEFAEVQLELSHIQREEELKHYHKIKKEVEELLADLSSKVDEVKKEKTKGDTKK